MPLNSSIRMQHVVGIVGLLIVILASWCEASAQKSNLPRFEDHRVPKTFSGKPVPVNLRSHSKARLFRTMLKLSAEKGPNFAGHYTVGTWGCGSDCRMVAVIDAVTGRVYFAPFQVSTGATFHLDSSLFIANESESDRYLAGEEMLDVYMPAWYVWRRGRFVEIFKTQAVRIRRKNRRE
jgi:hypothetical protein